MTGDSEVGVYSISTSCLPTSDQNLVVRVPQPHWKLQWRILRLRIPLSWGQYSKMTTYNAVLMRSELLQLALQLRKKTSQRIGTSSRIARKCPIKELLPVRPHT